MFEQRSIRATVAAHNVLATVPDSRQLLPAWPTAARSFAPPFLSRSRCSQPVPQFYRAQMACKAGMQNCKQQREKGELEGNTTIMTAY